MTGRVHRPYPDRSQFELPTIIEGLMVMGGAGVPMDVDHRSRGCRETTVAGDVIGVVVGFQDALN